MITNFWSMHSRQLSRFVNTLRTDLKTLVTRMQTNAESWEVSQQVAGHKINSHADDLNHAMEQFINFMTNLTLESLKLEGSRTRARAASREDNLVDLEVHLMNSMDAVTTNLDSVTLQMELLMDAVSQYNHLNPLQNQRHNHMTWATRFPQLRPEN